MYMDEPKSLIQMFSSFEIFSTTWSVSITPLFLNQSTAIEQEAANKALPGAVLRNNAAFLERKGNTIKTLIILN